MGEPRLGAEKRPGQEGQDRGRDDDRHEHRRHAVGDALDRRARALGLRDQRHDVGEQRIGAHPLGAHHETARCVHGGSRELASRGLLDRNRLAGDHRLIHRRGALLDGAVHRDLLAGPNAQAVARLHLLERSIALAAVGEDDAGGLGREAEEGADRVAGAGAGAKLEDLPEQDQRGDDGGGLEVHRDTAVHPERLREDPGSYRRHQGVSERGAGADRDQREHVEPPGHNRAPSADEERGPAPQHDRSRECELQPRHPGRLEGMAERGRHPAHRDEQQRQGERRADPEPPRHVHEFGVGRFLERNRARLESHAADRAFARTRLHHLGMHRADVLGAGGRLWYRRLERHPAGWAGAGPDLVDLGAHRTNVLGRGGRRSRTRLGGRRGRPVHPVAPGCGQDPLGVGIEALGAARVAEEIGCPAVLTRDRVRLLQHLHATNGIGAEEFPDGRRFRRSGYRRHQRRHARGHRRAAEFGDETLRVGVEPGGATGAAEVVRGFTVPPRDRVRLLENLHPAHRVEAEEPLLARCRRHPMSLFAVVHTASQPHIHYRITEQG